MRAIISGKSHVLAGLCILAAAVLLSPVAARCEDDGGMTAAAKTSSSAVQEQTQVTPAEDLMREHGLLSRLLLIYDAATARMRNAEPLPSEEIHQAALIIRSFVEDYHEKLEEEYVFPQVKKAGQQAETVDVLKRQHDEGRKLTDYVLTHYGANTPGDMEKLQKTLEAFTILYRPHKAREDTVIFPLMHTVFSAREYGMLGERFEAREKQLFGEKGFEGMVSKVAEIEQKLGINDLSQFDPGR